MTEEHPDAKICGEVAQERCGVSVKRKKNVWLAFGKKKAGTEQGMRLVRCAGNALLEPECASLGNAESLSRTFRLGLERSTWRPSKI